MEMTQESAEGLVQQLQHAHRICVAFYKRILPTLDRIAEELDCEFSFWEPLHSSRPGRKNSKPSATWAWDYVPLFASNHVYLRIHGEHAEPGDVGLCLCVYVDYGFFPDERKKHRVNGEPDAVTLPIGKAVLQAWIYRPAASSPLSFEELWMGAADPVIGTGQAEPVAENINAIAFEWPLSEVFQDIQPIVEQLKRHTV
jgi:hypothetical protein